VAERWSQGPSVPFET